MPFADSIDSVDVAPDHAMIMAQQKEVVTAGIVTGRTFPLLELPPELRVMVYEPLIEAGDISILRVSKLISQEALPLLSKVAILRLILGRRTPMAPVQVINMVSSGLLTPIAPEYIQNVNLRLNKTSYYGSHVDPRILHYFSGNTITRKVCSITIFFGPFVDKSYESNFEIYQAIARLTGFKVLLLKLEWERSANYQAFMLMTHGPAQGIKMIMGSTRILLDKDYKSVSAKLETTLGPAEFKEGYYLQSLRFQPSKYKVETA